MISLPTEGTGSDPIRVVVLFSGGASGAKFLFEEAGDRDNNYDIVAGLTDNPEASGVNVFQGRGLPLKVVDRTGPPGDPGTDKRKEAPYFEKLAEEAGKFEPDLLLLSGFMRVVRGPLLSEYAGEIINVHPADLSLEEDGRRKYRGSDTVYRSIRAGEERIRATVHFVTEEVDAGPLLVLSPPVRIERDMVRSLQRFRQEKVRDYAEVLQEWMKWSCDGPAILKALNLIGAGSVRVSGGRTMIKVGDEFTPGYYDMERGKVIRTGGLHS